MIDGAQAACHTAEVAREVGENVFQRHAVDVAVVKSQASAQCPAMHSWQGISPVINSGWTCSEDSSTIGINTDSSTHADQYDLSNRFIARRKGK
jgi:hypothetical protein